MTGDPAPPCSGYVNHVPVERHLEGLPNLDGWREVYCARHSCGLVLFDPRKSRALDRAALRRAHHTHSRDKKVAYLLRRDGPGCGYCGIVFSPDGKSAPGGRVTLPTIDHRVPRSLGGHNRYSNLILACGWCNHSKGHMAEAEFRASARLAERRRHLAREANRAKGFTNDGMGYWHPDIRLPSGELGCLICGKVADRSWPLVAQPCLMSVRED